MVSAPAFVGGDAVEDDLFGVDATLAELLADDSLPVGVGDVDVDGLALGDVVDDEGEGCGDGVVSVGETDSLGPGPTEPGCGLRFPFGGEAIAQFSGGCGHDFGGWGHGG